MSKDNQGFFQSDAILNQFRSFEYSYKLYTIWKRFEETSNNWTAFLDSEAIFKEFESILKNLKQLKRFWRNAGRFWRKFKKLKILQGICINVTEFEAIFMNLKQF